MCERDQLKNNTGCKGTIVIFIILGMVVFSLVLMSEGKVALGLFFLIVYVIMGVVFAMIYNRPEAGRKKEERASAGYKHRIILNQVQRDTGYKRRSIPKRIQREVWRRDRGRCVECGSQENLEYDHIIPVSKGGANTARNIQLLCESCNRRKHAKIG